MGNPMFYILLASYALQLASYKAACKTMNGAGHCCYTV